MGQFARGSDEDWWRGPLARNDVDSPFRELWDRRHRHCELGFSVIGLDLPDDNGFADTLVLAGQVIVWLGPDLVVRRSPVPQVTRWQWQRLYP